VTRRAALVLAALLPLGPVQAAGTGAAMLALPVSVRQAGMGGVAVGGRDPGAAWTNPALLSSQAARSELAFGGGSLFAGDQSALSMAGSYRASERLVAGAVVASYGASAAEVDANGAATGATLDRRLTAAGLAGAVPLGRVRLGVLAKVVNDAIAGDAATAVAFDAGATVALEPLTAGISYRNLGPSLRADSAATPGGVALPGEVRGHVAFAWAGPRLVAAVEGVLPTGSDARIAGGLEWQAARALALRAGADDLANAGERMALGLTLTFGVCDIDYALVMHPAGTAQRASIAYAWGRPAPAAPTTRTIEVPVAPVAEADRINIAVQELAPQGVSASDAAVISDILRSELVRTGAFKVLERTNMEKLLAEHSFQQTGCTTEECAIKLGKMLNVQRMIVGSAGKLLSAYIVSVRVVNVQTGEIMYSDEARGTDDRDLTARLRDLAGRLSALASR